MNKTLTMAELDVQQVELLPARETLSFDANLASVYASNSALAVNAATILSAAQANALQSVVVSQG